MAFCTNCGGYVEDGVKFCGHCGAKMTVTKTVNTPPVPPIKPTEPRSSQRESFYEGQIHKCPNCGATLSSFVKNCPDCGYELRGASSTYSVQEFSRRYASAANNSQKNDLIRTYVIPNTKEDILEFIILASSNIDSNTYSSSDVVVSGGVSSQDITEAWMAKFEQAHQKANLLLSDDPYLEKINKLYADKKKALENARSKSKKNKVVKGIFGSKTAGIVALFALLIGIGIIFPLLMGGSGERKLEKQVKQIEAYIAEGNYDAALTTAYAMSDNYSTSWSETRASLIKRILDLQGKGEGNEIESHAGLVQIPTQRLTGKQVSDVMSIFTTAGFTNVTKEPVSRDLLTGWLDKITDTKGEVDEISINGDTHFSPGAWVDPDCPVIIRYND